MSPGTRPGLADSPPGNDGRRLPSGLSVIRSRAEFARLRRAWNECLATMPGAHLFLTHEWLAAWLEHQGRGAELFVPVVADGGAILAAAPLVRRRGRYYGLPVEEIVLIGNHTSDRVQFLVQPDHEDLCETLWRAILAECGQWRIVRLEQVPATAPTVTRRPVRGCRVGCEPTSSLPFIDIAGSWEDFEKSLAPKFRSKLRNKEKTFAHWGDWTLRVVRGCETIDHLDQLVAVELDSAKAAGGYAFFASATNVEFARALLRSSPPLDPLLCELVIGDEVVAYTLGFIHGGVYFGYNMAYRRGYEAGNCGKWLIHQTFKYAFEHGLRGLDLLRGASDVKRNWRPRLEQNCRLVVFPRNPLFLPHKLAVFHVRPALKSLVKGR